MYLWWTGRPGVLQFMGSQRVGHEWATDLIWSDLIELLHLQLQRTWSIWFLRVLQKSSKTVFCYPLRWNQDPAPRLHYCFLAAPPLSLHCLLCLVNNCLNLPFGIQERSWSLESIPCYKRWETQKEFGFQDPVSHWKMILRHCYSAAIDLHRDVTPRGRISNKMVLGWLGWGQLGVWGNRVKGALLLDL